MSELLWESWYFIDGNRQISQEMTLLIKWRLSFRESSFSSSICCRLHVMLLSLHYHAKFYYSCIYKS